MKSLSSLLAEAARTDPDALAFAESDRLLTYADWDAAATRAAAGFLRLGLQPGDVVALLLPNGIDYPVAYLGAARAGLVTTGINPRYRSHETGHILSSSGAAALVTVDEIDGVRTGEILDSIRPASLREVISPGELEHDDDVTPLVRDPAPEDPVAIVYTSGTTGLPKGATYTAGAIDAIVRIEMSIDPSPHPRTMGGLPMPHMYFMTKIGYAIVRHAATIFLDTWSARAALRTIESERLTVVGGVPTQLTLMLMDATFDSTDLSSLRSVVVGGAPASPELIRRIRRGFGVPVLVRYSCTELGLATGTRVEDPDEVVATTVGSPLPEVELRIADPATGVARNVDEVGEVCVRSPAMMDGYWSDPAATEAAFDSDGFYRTGDLGFVGRDGNLRLSGRAKEMYIRGGYNVYPVEVEAVLQQHPKVSLAAVVGVPDEVLGERGRAFVVAKDPLDPPTEEELRAFVAGRLADYKRPDAVEIRTTLPLTSMFKVDKASLTEEDAPTSGRTKGEP